MGELKLGIQKRALCAGTGLFYMCVSSHVCMIMWRPEGNPRIMAKELPTLF